MFDIGGSYEFILSLGFQVETVENVKIFYLPKKNLNVPLYEKLLAYIELLALNFQDNQKEQQNYCEKNSIKKSVYTEDYFKKDDDEINNNNKNNDNDNDDNFNFNYDILSNLKESEEIEIKNNEPSNEGLKILKETGEERYQNALQYGQAQKKNNNNNKKDISKENQNKPNIHTLGDIQQKSNDNKKKTDNKKNTDNKKDTKFKPNINFGDKYNKKNNDFKKTDKFKPNINFGDNYKKNINNNKNVTSNQKNKSTCKDEIGKKCLELTNAFRAEHNLPPLEWNDDLWKLSYTHSKNMGDKKVSFGHDGFQDRVSKFPFSYNMACENVYFCSGYEYDTIAENGVDGCINSPGHRKNLLSNTNLCAIASYKNRSGAYYLTQLFAKKT